MLSIVRVLIFQVSGSKYKKDTVFLLNSVAPSASLCSRMLFPPSVPYVLVTETSSRSIGLEDVCDTCCRRFTSKQTSAARHKNVLAQRPCQHLAETLKLKWCNLFCYHFFVRVI